MTFRDEHQWATVEAAMARIIPSDDGPGAREAGAAVTDAFGHPLIYNKRDPRAFGVLVSAPAIHAAAVDRLAARARDFARRDR